MLTTHTGRYILSLHPSSQRRERILLYGPQGSGKSSAWLNIAHWLAKTQSPNKLYALDTDRAWEAMDPGNLDGTVIVKDAESWLDCKQSVVDWKKKATRDDWLVVDMADRIWDWAQQSFFDKAFGADIDEFFLEAKKTGAAVGGSYGSNWGVINKMYAAVVDPMQRFPGHVIACTPSSDIWEPDRSGKGGDSTETRKTYGRLGQKPQGQKNLGHLFHTILYMQESPSGWVMSTAKERNPPGNVARPYLKGEKVEQFVLSYLFKVAGWRP